MRPASVLRLRDRGLYVGGFVEQRFAEQKRLIGAEAEGSGAARADFERLRTCKRRR